ncbi:hypothetical protein XENTR_v10002613 [Xenopus tropicalis]|uniref:Dual specificity protein phosphatase 18 n=1 Tax=Xenopus tropicalis TaxID=8364 RepID=A0A7D9NLL1_XENTR|nr:dual specificity protein phosphatase 18 [Xenopus tropicalis]XP_017946129.1 dual specificity protein phosphatase 18 [Xenopus tropicalis]KAE8635414.1 hypothetical protein XENTR_v10002613 [Xenopus tropicalis]KAE8635415.1 hypothetical protein XENTR_v10002613 [Xenopus tropicalis]|eukprot:XP_017946129.1 PREDICTED: dual specificity protein phosphatase 18 [Xenopus tropicalis]
MEEGPCSLSSSKRSFLSGLNSISEGLYLASAKAARNRTLLATHCITCVINVSLEIDKNESPELEYVHIPVPDTPDTCLLQYFDDIADKIHNIKVSGGSTLLHCVAGISRSPTLCLAYLMKYHSLSLLAAHARVKMCRPIIRPNLGFWKQLMSYEMTLFGKNTITIIDSPVGPIPDIYEKETKNLVPF